MGDKIDRRGRIFETHRDAIRDRNLREFVDGVLARRIVDIDDGVTCVEQSFLDRFHRVGGSNEPMQQDDAFCCNGLRRNADRSKNQNSRDIQDARLCWRPLCVELTHIERYRSAVFSCQSYALEFMTLRRFFLAILIAGAGAAVWLVLRASSSTVSVTTAHVDLAQKADAADLQIPEESDEFADEGDLPLGNAGEMLPADQNAFSITFPDGEVIHFPLHPRPQRTRRFPEIVIDDYGSLRHDAEEGDAEAAFILGASLRSCRHSAPTQAALDQAIDELYQTQSYSGFRGQGRIVVESTKEVELFERSLRDGFSTCRGLSEQQIGEGAGWLEQAADMGDLRAMARVVSVNAASPKNFEYVQQLWDAGDAIALGWLAQYYAGRHGNSIVEPDRVKAYAFVFLSTNRLMGGRSAFPANPSPRTRMLQDHLAAESAKLSPLEIEQALEMAKSLLMENANCCMDW